MPDRVKEKLVELVCKAHNAVTEKALENADMSYAEAIGIEADVLIANGVTVQEWIPVSEPPKKNGRYLVYDCDTGNYYDSYFDETEGEFGEWQNCFDPFTLGVIDCEWNSCPNVTHWMPLPQPPKGE